MSAAPPRPKPDRTRRSCWMFGVSGLALLVLSVIMMASGAQPSPAQTVRPAQAPAQLLDGPSPHCPTSRSLSDRRAADREPAEVTPTDKERLSHRTA
jgi:hypothetical protein